MDITHPTPRINLKLSTFFAYGICTFCKINSSNRVWNITHDESYYYESCNSTECLNKCKNAVLEEEKKDYVYGFLYYLKNKQIKVKRTSGIIENDWVLRPGIIDSDTLGKAILCVKIDHDGKELEKYIPLNEVLEMNPN
jgi:hypothetical protein